MRATLRLEIIAENYHWARRNAAGSNSVSLRESIRAIRYGRKELYPWVAHITGNDDRYELKREFLEGYRDYTNARRDGFRGVYIFFALPPGVYEINEPTEPGVARRFFARVEDATITEISREDVLCLINAI